MPLRPSLWRLFAGSASPSMADLKAQSRADRARARARAQESLARHDTRPFASIDVGPADDTLPFGQERLP